MTYPSKTSVSSHSEIYYLNKNNPFYRYLKYLHLLKLQLNVNIPCSLFNRCLLKHCVARQHSKWRDTNEIIKVTSNTENTATL